MSAAAESSDPLAAIISLLRPQAVLPKAISGAGRWSVRYTARAEPGFCIMLEGTCFLDVNGMDTVKLEEGDFVLLPSTPGFFGIFEGAATVGLAVYGVPHKLAVSWAIGYHILTFIPITAIGAVYFARLGLGLKDMKGAA